MQLGQVDDVARLTTKLTLTGATKVSTLERHIGRAATTVDSLAEAGTVHGVDAGLWQPVGAFRRADGSISLEALVREQDRTAGAAMYGHPAVGLPEVQTVTGVDFLDADLLAIFAKNVGSAGRLVQVA